MHKWMLAASFLLAAALARGAELDVSHCRFPEPPSIPDGATASESEMGQAGADVRDFVADIQSSLECLTDTEQSMGEEISEEQQAQLVAIYNNGVDQMNAVAAKYNEQVRAYKGEDEGEEE